MAAATIAARLRQKVARLLAAACFLASTSCTTVAGLRMMFPQPHIVSLVSATDGLGMGDSAGSWTRRPGKPGGWAICRKPTTCNIVGNMRDSILNEAIHLYSPWNVSRSRGASGNLFLGASSQMQKPRQAWLIFLLLPSRFHSSEGQGFLCRGGRFSWRPLSARKYMHRQQSVMPGGDLSAVRDSTGYMLRQGSKMLERCLCLR